MRSSTNPRIRDASQGLLHQLGLVDIHDEPPVEQSSLTPTSRSPSRPSMFAQPREPPPSYQETMGKGHIMISYQWDHQARAIRIKDKLTMKGYNVWMDIEKLGTY